MTSRSRAESIRYACRGADLLTAHWLDWYGKKEKSQRSTDMKIKEWSNFNSQTAQLWPANFRHKLYYSEDEWNARVCDAIVIGQRKPKVQPVHWKEEHSPWIMWAADFLNKEIGPGPELCKAWEELRRDRNIKMGRTMSEFDRLLRSKSSDTVLP